VAWYSHCGLVAQARPPWNRDGVTDEMGGRLTADEGRLMLSLLARYCAYDLDQFDFWRIELPGSSDAYVRITDGAPNEDAQDLYRKVWPLPPGT
jgi:hypothetical protein